MEYLNFWSGLLTGAIGCTALALVYAIYKDTENEAEKLIDEAYSKTLKEDDDNMFNRADTTKDTYIAKGDDSSLAEFMNFRPELDYLMKVIDRDGKPKLTIHRKYTGDKCWYCESGVALRLIVGVGETPKEAYRDWVNLLCYNRST